LSDFIIETTQLSVQFNFKWLKLLRCITYKEASVL